VKVTRDDTLAGWLASSDRHLAVPVNDDVRKYIARGRRE
jgi:hypothetical protein